MKLFKLRINKPLLEHFLYVKKNLSQKTEANGFIKSRREAGRSAPSPRQSTGVLLFKKAVAGIGLILGKFKDRKGRQ